MMCRVILRHALVVAAMSTLFLMPSFSYAQVNEKQATSIDEKIRDIDGVAAVVNTGYITRKEIDDRVLVLKAKTPQLGDGPDIRKRILDQIILEKIQLQNAELEGISVSDKELNQIISGIAAQNKLSMADFKLKVASSGTSYERYRQLLREDIIVSRYREREIEGKIKISDAEIDNFIADQNRTLSGKPFSLNSPSANGAQEEIAVAQIFIPVDPKAGEGTKTQAKKKADLLLSEARGDIDFLQLGAKAVKEDPTIKFQELGYRLPDRLPQLFYEAVRNTGSGQVANAVVKSPAGYHVLKVLDRRTLSVGISAPQQQSTEDTTSVSPKNIMVTQTMSRHILLRSREGLTDQDAQRRLAGYRDQVRAKTSDFGDLAKKYSEDGSAKNGGNLGWMGPGDLVPEFDQAMNRLQIGDVSDPVKTQFGWHLIQVLERRQAELTIEKQQQFARAAIRERKFEQAYQDWLRELRDTATVKIINADDPASSPR